MPDDHRHERHSHRYRGDAGGAAWGRGWPYQERVGADFAPLRIIRWPEHADSARRRCEKGERARVCGLPETGAAVRPSAASSLQNLSCVPNCSRPLRVFSAGGDRRAKRLLSGVLWQWARGFAMMLVAQLPADAGRLARIDVVFVKDYKRAGFRAGIEGVGPTMESVWAALPANLGYSSYRDVLCMGVSGGGMMAMLTALTLNLARAIAVGPNSPDEERWNFDGRSGRDRVLAARGGNPSCQIQVLFGSHAPLDRQAGEVLKEIASAELIEVSLPGHRGYAQCAVCNAVEPSPDRIQRGAVWLAPARIVVGGGGQLVPPTHRQCRFLRSLRRHCRGHGGSDGAGAHVAVVVVVVGEDRGRPSGICRSKPRRRW